MKSKIFILVIGIILGAFAFSPFTVTAQNEREFSYLERIIDKIIQTPFMQQKFIMSDTYLVDTETGKIWVIHSTHNWKNHVDPVKVLNIR